MVSHFGDSLPSHVGTVSCFCGHVCVTRMPPPPLRNGRGIGGGDAAHRGLNRRHCHHRGTKMVEEMSNPAQTWCICSIISFSAQIIISSLMTQKFTPAVFPPNGASTGEGPFGRHKPLPPPPRAPPKKGPRARAAAVEASNRRRRRKRARAVEDISPRRDFTFSMRF